MGTQSVKIKFLVLGCVLLFAVLQARSQGVYARISGEATAPGLRYGGTLGYVSKRNFHAGVFYQRAVPSAEHSSMTTDLMGVETLVVMVNGEKLNLSAHLRAGLADKRFIVLIPGLRTSLQVVRGIDVAVGMHWRYNRPAHELSLQFKI